MNFPVTHDPDGLISRVDSKPATGCPVRITGASVSSDSNVTRLPVPDEVVSAGCDRLQGGVIKPVAPVFTPVVKNEGDLLWRDEDYRLVTTDDLDTIIIDNT